MHVQLEALIFAKSSLTDLMGCLCVAKFQQANRPLERNEFSVFYKLYVHLSLI